MKVYNNSMAMWRFTTVLLLVTLALLSGCKKKTPQLPPVQTAPPTITEPAPTTQPPPKEETAPVTTPPPKAVETKPTTPTPTPPRRVTKKTTPAKPAQKPPTRVIVEDDEPVKTAPPLSASVSGSATSQQRRATEHLIQAAEINLKELNRTLTPEEETFVRRVRSFITQSRAASEQGDLERAYNLALKAQLLSDELLKH